MAASKSFFAKSDNIVFSTLQVKLTLNILRLSSKSFTFNNPCYVPSNFDLMYYSLTSSSQRNIETIFVKQYTSFQTVYPKDYQHFLGHRHNLKAVPQNFMEVFKFDDIIQKKQHGLRKEKLQISHTNHYCQISIFSIKLLKKT